MGSMSKALGSIGGFIAGDRSLIDFLKNKARSFIYTTALPPAACAASLAALELIRENPSLREKLWDNITYLKSRLSQYKNAPAVHSPIIPLVIGPAEETLRISEKLYQNNILIPAIRPPTVPAGTSRLRISLMATHTANDIDRLIEAFEKTGALTPK